MNTYDEAIGRLRDEYQLDLKDVFTDEDLKKKFEKLEKGKGKGRDNLIKNYKPFFEDSNKVQDEVTTNFEGEIKTRKEEELESLKVEDNVRDKENIETWIEEAKDTIFEEKTDKYVEERDVNAIVKIEPRTERQEERKQVFLYNTLNPLITNYQKDKGELGRLRNLAENLTSSSDRKDIQDRIDEKIAKL